MRKPMSPGRLCTMAKQAVETSSTTVTAWTARSRSTRTTGPAVRCVAGDVEICTGCLLGPGKVGEPPGTFQRIKFKSPDTLTHSRALPVPGDRYDRQVALQDLAHLPPAFLQ